MPASQARKARRALERGEAAPVKPSKVSTPSKKRKPAGTSQDADKAAGSAKQPSGGETAGDATETDDASVKTGQKRVATTLFIGQLPYQASAKDIEKHFSQAACGGAVKVRLLTKRDSNASKGMAFVEMGSEAAVHSALRLHHSCIFGRRINVERTVGGGGNDEARKQKLQSLRECQGKQMLKSARELVERILPAGGEAGEDADDEVPGATLDDVDDRLLEFVTSIQPVKSSPS
jgi:RNA recognition motif-containing protein|tara:strand:+ start:621 stop:1322 length:702 start_codon:yes stop_codon:yes gene_type:complete